VPRPSRLLTPECERPYSHRVTVADTAKTLADSKYVLLTTFRKDGTRVPTAVWVMPHDDGFSIWTGVNTGKVKRIRRNSSVEVATCNRFGKASGEPVAAHAEMLDRSEAARVLAALRSKYGLLASLYVRFAHRGERAARMAYLKVTVG
jgi:uncharacterized protein